MTKVKICGIRSMNDARFVNEAKPDYAGFVFAKSRRQIGPEQAVYLRKALSRDIRTVGVFVNEDLGFIQKLCRARVIDMVQLHGDEDEITVRRVMEATGLPTVKAVRIAPGRTHVDTPDTAADFTLFDTYSKEAYGGTGRCFDWSLVKDCGKPFFLAGGLHCENVADAIRAARPYCVDISGGVETNGKKDRDKIKQLLKQVRSMNEYE